MWKPFGLAAAMTNDNSWPRRFNPARPQPIDLERNTSQEETVEETLLDETSPALPPEELVSEVPKIIAECQNNTLWRPLSGHTLAWQAWSPMGWGRSRRSRRENSWRDGMLQAAAQRRQKLAEERFTAKISEQIKKQNLVLENFFCGRSPGPRRSWEGTTWLQTLEGWEPSR